MSRKYTIYKNGSRRPVLENITEEQALTRLKIQAETLRQKVLYHELVRGTWYVTAEDVTPIPAPDGTRALHTGFTDLEWSAFCDEWNRTRERLGAKMDDD